jgi:hypothetical protein
VTRFFNNIKNHIMEGSVPDSIPNFTPHNANPKIIQAANVIAPDVKIATLKVKPDALPTGTPACECIGKKQKLKPAAGTKDFTKAGLVCCKEGTPILVIAFQKILRRSTALSFVSMIRNAPSPIGPVILIISESGTRLLSTTRSKFLSTAMQLKEDRFGSMPTPLQSTGPQFPTSMLTS